MTAVIRAFMHRPHLQRPASAHQRSPLYFVTMCTHARQPPLANEGAHECFRLFAQQSPQHGIYAGRYVLMPDHLRLFVEISATADRTLSEWAKSLKNSLSTHWRALQTPSPHWQKSFFDRPLRSEESYAEKWDYVRQNPVRAGLIGDADAWPFAGAIEELELCRRS